MTQELPGNFGGDPDEAQFALQLMQMLNPDAFEAGRSIGCFGEGWVLVLGDASFVCEKDDGHEGDHAARIGSPDEFSWPASEGVNVDPTGFFRQSAEETA